LPDASLLQLNLPKKQGIKSKVYDSIINKTPLSYRTNRILGGASPSEYLAKLEKGNQATPAIDRGKLDGYLSSHMIAPDLLRANKFVEFMDDRQKRLLALIEQATGKPTHTGPFHCPNRHEPRRRQRRPNPTDHRQRRAVAVAPVAGFAAHKAEPASFDLPPDMRVSGLRN